jgi:type III secretory pathway component EscR
VAELTKKNQQSFDEFKNSLIKSQESNNHKILSTDGLILIFAFLFSNLDRSFCLTTNGLILILALLFSVLERKPPTCPRQT